MKKIIVKAPNEIGVLFFGFSIKLKNFFRKYNTMRIDFFSMIQKRSIINRFCPKNGRRKFYILLDFWVHRCYYLCVHESEVILWYEWVDRLITQKTML